jgi:hypothetical protein
MRARDLWTVVCVAWLSGPLLASGAEPDFSRDIRPVLARHCFKCHGPDDKARKAKLRLDVREASLRGGKSGQPAIVPGKPDESELIRRVCSREETETMPPPATRNPLSERQKQLLRRWIAAGAEYQQHWAFVPPRQAPLPKVQRTDWPRNPIDHFVLAKLEAAGLAPSPQADRATLVRRLYLDLIGLPPTLDEADAFIQDDAPDAYEKLVDRLLASPHYGERWARRWLDLARYADTNGYEKDRVRSMWPYRDWVIGALNQDLPFDRFTIEQIAGDMLPGATLEQRIATGFHRNTMINEEGGIDPQEFRFHAMTDRVATTGTVWLGLTVGCAQCHTHKYDPIPQREYYRFMACLNNADEPVMEVPTPELVRRRAEQQTKIRTMIGDLAQRFPPEDAPPAARVASAVSVSGAGPRPKDDRPLEVRRREHLEKKFGAWLRKQTAGAVHWQVLRPFEAKANLPLLHVLEDDSVLASSDQTKRDVYDLQYRKVPQGITAIRLEVLPHESLPQRGPGRVYYEGAFGDFFLSELSLTADGQPVKLSRATSTFAGGKNKASLAIDGDPHTGWSINGSQGTAQTAVFNLASPLPVVKVLGLQMIFEQYYAAGLGRFRISVTTDKRTIEASGLLADIEDMLLIASEKRTPQQRERLFKHYLSVAPELAGERETIHKLEKQLPAYPTTLVMKERPGAETRPTYLHERGEFLKATEKVEPDVLSLLPGLPKEAPRNRLTFARWLVDPGNPLVGRVTMNRQWAAFFGRGMVRTTEDFGFQGEPPTHPELLDWLAVELVRRGWSMKQMHRLIVTSATYRQSSRVNPELLAKDPQNKLLARGPRFRLEAELVRDAALKVSGLLAPKIGGPSVFPAQPPGVSSEGAYGPLTWTVSKGADRYRRGLYTFSKRTAPFAMFNTFDAPSGEACVARREVSNTPLQALTLLNDTVFMEAAQQLGREGAAAKGPVKTRAAWLFRRCLVRVPNEGELKLLVDFFDAQKRRFTSKEFDAGAVAGQGSGDVCERAAWTTVARALLNLDEMIIKH